METERDGYLCFLDIDVYRSSDGSLGHKVYHKPTHTNLYLNSSSQPYPVNEVAVLSTLLHGARALCDQDSLHMVVFKILIPFIEIGRNTQINITNSVLIWYLLLKDLQHKIT
jgi:hypothetical protein